MRHLTIQEVIEEYGGNLPADAVLRPDEDEAPPPPPPPAARPERRPARGGRWPAFNAFVDCSLAGLTAAETKVWLILFRDTKKDGTARTGQADLARRAGLSERMVRYALVDLEAKGLVRVVRRGRLSAGPSVYRVHPTGTA